MDLLVHPGGALLKYDPKSLGAKCDECPLKDQTPVPPQRCKNPELVVIGKHPGGAEVDRGAPLKGYAGVQFEKHLRGLNKGRGSLFIDNMWSCMPHRKLREREMKKATECCKPRLLKELEATGSAPVFTMGNPPFQGLMDTNEKAANWRGAGLVWEGRYLMPSLMSPLIMAPELSGIFRTDLRRAYRQKVQSWPAQTFFIEPGDEMLSALRRMRGKPLSVDIENIGDPLRQSHIRCIGVSTGDLTVCVPTEELDPTDPCMVELENLLAAPTLKIMHNAQHDTLGLIELGWSLNYEDLFDTMYAHATLYNQLPHDLGFIVSQFYAFPKWKAEHKVSGENDKGLELFKNMKIRKLQWYCCKDAYGTFLLYVTLNRALEAGWVLV